MGWRFRRSFKVIPGVRLNLSRSGLSCSIGGAPVTMNVGPRGVQTTVSIPGTGISVRKRISGQSRRIASDARAIAPAAAPSLPYSPPVSIALPIEEVRSGSTELLTSESLKELKRIIQTANQEYQEISRELDAAQREKRRALEKYASWNDGFLLKRIFKKTFAKRKTESETTCDKVQELEQQLRL